MLIHLDADAFFASVEQAADKSLRGKAMAVGGMKRGIIASASYEARRCGVYTPMPTSRALRVCPHLIVLPGDFERYEIFSRLMFTYAYDFTPLVERTSIDEGYFDLGGNRKVRAEVAAERIRKAITGSLKIGVSEGVASNKLVSQVASKLQKPYGFVQVAQGEEREFLQPLDIRWLPGVGAKTGGLLHSAGLAKIGQVAEASERSLRMVVGNAAPRIREHARGIDERPVVADRGAAKSYGHQTTFGEDTADHVYLLSTLKRLLDDLIIQLRDDKSSARTITVKVRYADMDEATRSESLEEPGDLAEDFYPAVERLFKKAWDRRVRLRLVCVRLSNIYNSIAPPSLLYAAQREKRGALQNVVSELRSKYGERALMRGHDFSVVEQKRRAGGE